MRSDNIIKVCGWILVISSIGCFIYLKKKQSQNTEDSFESTKRYLTQLIYIENMIRNMKLPAFENNAISLSLSPVISNQNKQSPPLEIKQNIIDVKPVSSNMQKIVQVEEKKSDIYDEWLRILKPPFRCLIIGKAGSGKSALGHFLLEMFRFQKRIYIFGFPEDKIKFLPEYVNVVKSFDQVLPDSICLIDESYLSFYSRESMACDKNKVLLEILGLFRHRNIILIFITQSTGLIDRNIVFMTDYIIFKEISDIQIGFERPELRPLFREAKEVFEKIKDNKRTYNFVISTGGNFKKTLKNPLPSYWNEAISTAFFSWEESGEKEGKTIKKEEKKEMAKQLYQKGYSYKQVAKILGVSKATIINWVKHNK